MPISSISTLTRAFFRISHAGLIACVLSVAPLQAQEYPLEIQHAFGTTVITQKPVRVASVAWANHEVPLALGVVPVGFAAANFGDDDNNGLLPWVEAALNDLGATAPALFDEGDGIDFEAVAQSAPDVILAAYSGLSQSDYDTLSKIAPVVAYPETPWATDWRDMILLNSTGMGMAAEGAALVGQIETEIAQTAARFPELAGKSAMFVTHLNPMNLSTIGFYTDNDTRVQLFHDLGLVSPAVIKNASESGRFSGQISVENVDMLQDADILVTYGTPELLEKMSENTLTARLPAVSQKSLVLLGNSPLGTAANPTPLSISWVLEDYVRLLANAARNVK
ncbi:ABC transporter substrate-binding protein [Pacificibacter marinus]|uniref:Putative siderophore-binding lipoprotein YfiY n=1 Tax=Pacificibacter marinus TaxID=658057 RepID=A0A1Y5S6K5_9RHOB|nr:ABC transporter substrate-binding protein [Pacificibacter marinus]SEK79543.1 iron complex transport system substrate-binding protein [Pacificibacter marinus]SLN33105.1 putative siderophore-binding lipoprotein YfiY precursor [Pacificibacter marinus]